MRIETTRPEVYFGAGLWGKTPTYKHDFRMVRAETFVREHRFVLYLEDDQGEEIVKKEELLKFWGRHGIDENSSNRPGLYTDGETEEIDDGQGGTETVLVQKDLLTYILDGGDPQDPSITITTFGWPDFTSSAHYFDVGEDEKTVWSETLGEDLLTLTGRIDGMTQPEIDDVHENLLWMAQQAILTFISINGKTLAELNFSFT